MVSLFWNKAFGFWGSLSWVSWCHGPVRTSHSLVWDCLVLIVSFILTKDCCPFHTVPHTHTHEVHSCASDEAWATGQVPIGHRKQWVFGQIWTLHPGSPGSFCWMPLAGKFTDISHPGSFCSFPGSVHLFPPFRYWKFFSGNLCHTHHFLRADYVLTPDPVLDALSHFVRLSALLQFMVNL